MKPNASGSRLDLIDLLSYYVIKVAIMMISSISKKLATHQGLENICRLTSNPAKP
jgi:hypothetical protein